MNLQSASSCANPSENSIPLPSRVYRPLQWPQSLATGYEAFPSTLDFELDQSGFQAHEGRTVRQPGAHVGDHFLSDCSQLRSEEAPPRYSLIDDGLLFYTAYSQLNEGEQSLCSPFPCSSTISEHPGRSTRTEMHDHSQRALLLARNRSAAARCRQKKKVREENSKDRVRELSDENLSLKEDIRVLRLELTTLKRACLAHVDCGCERIRQYLIEAAVLAKPHKHVYQDLP